MHLNKYHLLFLRWICTKAFICLCACRVSSVIPLYKLSYVLKKKVSTSPTLWQLSLLPSPPIPVPTFPHSTGPSSENSCSFSTICLQRYAVIKSLQCPKRVSCTHRILVSLWSWERWQLWLSLHHHSFKYLVTTRNSTDVSTKLRLTALVLNNFPSVIYRTKLQDQSELNCKMPKFWHLTFCPKNKSFIFSSVDNFS